MLRRVWSSSRVLRLAIGASLCAAAALVGLRAGPAESARPPLVGITVQPALASLIPGQTLTLRAIGSYADGSSTDITKKVYFREDSAVARITKDVLTARALGSVEIHAVSKSGGIVSDGSLALTVSRVAALAIDPPNAGVRLGSDTAWRALATLEDGATRVNVTDFVEWSASDPRIVRVGNTSRTKGVGRGLRAGSTTLEVVDPDSNTRAALALTVVSDLARVEVDPRSRFLQLDDTGRFEAIGVFEQEIEADISADVKWASSDRQTATIDRFGVTEPRRLGSAELIASDRRTRIRSADSETSGTVTVVGALLSIAVDPATREIPVGEFRRLRAFGSFEGSSGAFSLGRRVDWFSSDATVALPEADGDVHCLAHGTATLSARDQKSGLTSTATGGDGEVRCL